MNGDLISREALLQALVNLEPSGYERSFAGQAAIREILYAPTVDAEPVRHGRWIVDIKRLKATCSECGKILQFSNEMQIPLLRDEERFCCYCGAKMDGGTE